MRVVRGTAGYVLLTAIAVSASLFPVFYAVNTALKTPVEYGRRPISAVRHPTMANFSWIGTRCRPSPGCATPSSSRPA